MFWIKQQKSNCFSFEAKVYERLNFKFYFYKWKTEYDSETIKNGFFPICAFKLLINNILKILDNSTYRVQVFDTNSILSIATCTFMQSQ